MFASIGSILLFIIFIISIAIIICIIHYISKNK